MFKSEAQRVRPGGPGLCPLTPERPLHCGRGKELGRRTEGGVGPGGHPGKTRGRWKVAALPVTLGCPPGDSRATRTARSWERPAGVLLSHGRLTLRPPGGAGPLHTPRAVLSALSRGLGPGRLPVSPQRPAHAGAAPSVAPAPVLPGRPWGSPLHLGKFLLTAPLPPSSLRLELF